MAAYTLSASLEGASDVRNPVWLTWTNKASHQASPTSSDVPLTGCGSISDRSTSDTVDDEFPSFDRQTSIEEEENSKLRRQAEYSTKENERLQKEIVSLRSQLEVDVSDVVHEYPQPVVSDVVHEYPQPVHAYPQPSPALLPATKLVPALLPAQVIADNRSELASPKEPRSRPPKFIRERVRRRQQRAAQEGLNVAPAQPKTPQNACNSFASSSHQEKGLNVAPAQPKTPQNACNSLASNSHQEKGRMMANHGVQQSGADDLREHDGRPGLDQEALGAELATAAFLSQQLARLQAHIEQKTIHLHYQQVLLQQQRNSSARQQQPLQPFQMPAGRLNSHAGYAQADDVLRAQAKLSSFHRYAR